MPASIYPSTLPGPEVGWSAMLREAAVRSTLPGNPQARPRWSDAVEDVSPASWLYTGAEMAIWRPWWHTDLVDGQLWFLNAAPGEGGFIDRVMRARPSTLQVVPLVGRGICRVSFDLEIRGRSLAPQVA